MSFRMIEEIKTRALSFSTRFRKSDAVEQPQVRVTKEVAVKSGQKENASERFDLNRLRGALYPEEVA